MNYDLLTPEHLKKFDISVEGDLKEGDVIEGDAPVYDFGRKQEVKLLETFMKQ
eukprot:CAMPEP_0201538820 /NCGR_PEP_ID=MMETSP0161_2-20130828/68668_1 /ASSEMBLY_ACC=CAM_ASM_000251 /TAXON_ID=180227 /ORGANISM="Neoparamoeba aestuarina, Strain SoJaBio B1-5/56/2" /LENGTH=52 /DNA_ID=CAMNT_0047945879 /DNA_START=33 /DNA_END=188 /DNA_ORIENTATION=-